VKVVDVPQLLEHCVCHVTILGPVVNVLTAARRPPASYAHCIVTLTLDATETTSERRIASRAMFVSIANFDGAESRTSEKYKDSVAAQRAWNSLQTAVSAVANGRSDVCWNATKLNQVLSSCFGTPTLTTIIASVSPCETSTDNSMVRCHGVVSVL
jgi:hypothetical protein